jgi:histidinol-phosphate/aromatic aminotransferase/cobyric acid decarboxylase-like protein
MPLASLRQGGDTDDKVVLDLSTCVNPYGPPPSVIDALRNLQSDVIKRHPFSAPAFLEETYANRLHVARDEVIAVRGASEAIWQLARLTDDLHVSVPAPTYTEYVRAFPESSTILGAAPWHSIEQLTQAASLSDVVLFSNPHNPTGRYLEAATLAELFDAHPQTLFVIDESYADFIEDAAGASIVGCDATNVIALRSPTKFFGLGGVRAGVLWTRSNEWRERFLGLRTTWPISMIEARLVAAAFDDLAWQLESHKKLADDAVWLDGWLSQFTGVGVVGGPLHFRLVTGETSLVSEHLAKRGIRARELETAHCVGCPALRVSAPRKDLRNLLD